MRPLGSRSLASKHDACHAGLACIPGDHAKNQMNKIQVVLMRDKECKGSVRFALPDTQQKELIAKGTPPAVTNIYVSRSVPEVAVAKQVTVTLEM